MRIIIEETAALFENKGTIEALGTSSIRVRFVNSGRVDVRDFLVLGNSQLRNTHFHNDAQFSIDDGAFLFLDGRHETQGTTTLSGSGKVIVGDGFVDTALVAANGQVVFEVAGESGEVRIGATYNARAQKLDASNGRVVNKGRLRLQKALLVGGTAEDLSRGFLNQGELLLTGVEEEGGPFAVPAVTLAGILINEGKIVQQKNRLVMESNSSIFLNDGSYEIQKGIVAGQGRGRSTIVLNGGRLVAKDARLEGVDVRLAGGTILVNEGLESTGSITGGGRIEIASSARLDASFGHLALSDDSVLDNKGTLKLGSSTSHEILGSVAQISGESITGGTWETRGPLRFATDVVLNHIAADANVAIITSKGSIANLATTNLTNEGEFTLDFGGTLTLGTFINQSSGTTRVGEESTLIADRVVNDRGGVFKGKGLVKTPSFTIIASRLNPGSSPGVLTIDGNYFQSSDSTLEIELGGTLLGEAYDQLVVTGDASLDGTLELVFIDDFAPQQGQQFDILAVGGTTLGDFANVSVKGLLSGFEYDLSLAAGFMTLSALNDGILASCDLNADQLCDVTDIDLMHELGNLSEGVSNFDLPFDLNADGIVNKADVDRWLLLAAEKNGFTTSYLRGDANLDGEFNTTDLVELFSFGEYEDGVANNSLWSEGDFNSDNEFNTSDLVAAFAAGGYEQGPITSVRAVPEPSGWLLCLLASTIVLSCRIRPRTAVKIGSCGWDPKTVS